MVTSSSVSMSTSGNTPGSAIARTSAHRPLPAGNARSVRTARMCNFGGLAICENRSIRSSSAMSTTGALSFSAYSISGVVHHAFIPTTAAPTDNVAQ